MKSNWMGISEHGDIVNEDGTVEKTGMTGKELYEQLSMSGNPANKAKRLRKKLKRKFGK
jgi:hypothetical protein